MGYRIEQAGYEYNGIKLGDKVLFGREEVIVIGFDEYDDSSFIATNSPGDFGLHNSSCVTIILDGHCNSGYDWVSLLNIEKLQPDDSLPTDISPIHVADILEDVLKMDMTDPDEAFDVRCIITECIKSLRT